MRKLLALVLTALFALSEVVNISFAFQMERPNRIVEAINQREENAKVGDEASVGIGMDIVEYREGPNTPLPYYGHDGLRFRVIATSNTRKGIEYDYSIFSAPWFEARNPTGITGDDSGAWIPLPFDVTFYGGPGVQNSSGVYSKVWVSSNGFISFDSSSNSSVPTRLPSPVAPNTMIAAYWSDLDPTGGSITYEWTLLGFTVQWKNVLSKYDGERQTFQIVINPYHKPGYRGQNYIYLLYQDVTWPQISPSSIPPDEELPVTIGIEDQEGCKGMEPPYVDNGQAIKFYGQNSSPEIRSLNILMNKNDANAQIWFSTERWSKRGQNVKWVVPQPPPSSTPLLAKAIYGGESLLMTTIIGYANPVAGFILGTVLLTTDLGFEYYQYNYEKRLLETDPTAIQDELTNPGTDFAYLNASAATDAYGYKHPVDACVGTEIYWVFLDDNNLDHELTVTAQLQYYSNIEGKMKTVETSVTLNVYIGTPSTPTRPNGATVGYQGLTYSYSTSTTTPDGDSIYYQFDWDDGSNTTIGPYSSGATVSASHSWAAGTYSVRVRAKDSSYEIWSDYSSSLQVSIITSGPGNGCPFVSVWDGSQYVLDNNIFPTLVLSNGTDVEDYYRLEQALVPSQGKYSLLISEFQREHSYIDQVKLLAVDHESDINIAVSQRGEILAYKNPAAPISAIDNYGNDRLSEIRLMDGNESDPATYFDGVRGDYLILNFGQVNSDNAKLILRSDQYKKGEDCVWVQVNNGSGTWQTVEILVPRAFWSIEAVNLSPYLVTGQDLLIRLFWNSIHKLDYVGLDTTKQDDYEVRTANLVSATHSTQGDVKALLTENDNLYAELIPDQQIQLEFTLPNNVKQARTFILYTKGYYYTITL